MFLQREGQLTKRRGESIKKYHDQRESTHLENIRILKNDVKVRD